MENIENIAPIQIDTLHDILNYAFIYFQNPNKEQNNKKINFGRKIKFEDIFFEKYNLKSFEIEDIEMQEIHLENFKLTDNYHYLLNNEFITKENGITNKGIVALMKMDLIQFSAETNKQAKKWIALLERE